MLYEKSGNEKYGRAENNGKASGRAASRAIRLRHQFSVLSSRFSVSQRQGRRECHLFVFQFHAAIAFPCVPLCTSVFPVVQALARCHVSKAFSSFTPRDALSSTTSPSRVSRAS